MQHLGPNGMGGPLRGTSVWWHGQNNATQPPSDEETSPPAGGAYEDDPTIRKELVNRVRREIAEGVYDSPAKWEQALDRLMNRMYQE